MYTFIYVDLRPFQLPMFSSLDLIRRNSPSEFEKNSGQPFSMLG